MDSNFWHRGDHARWMIPDGRLFHLERSVFEGVVKIYTEKKFEQRIYLGTITDEMFRSLGEHEISHIIRDFADNPPLWVAKRGSNTAGVILRLVEICRERVA